VHGIVRTQIYAASRYTIYAAIQDERAKCKEIQPAVPDSKTNMPTATQHWQLLRVLEILDAHIRSTCLPAEARVVIRERSPVEECRPLVPRRSPREVARDDRELSAAGVGSVIVRGLFEPGVFSAT